MEQDTSTSRALSLSLARVRFPVVLAGVAAAPAAPAALSLRRVPPFLSQIPAAAARSGRSTHFNRTLALVTSLSLQSNSFAFPRRDGRVRRVSFGESPLSISPNTLCPRICAPRPPPARRQRPNECESRDTRGRQNQPVPSNYTVAPLARAARAILFCCCVAAANANGCVCSPDTPPTPSLSSFCPPHQTPGSSRACAPRPPDPCAPRRSAAPGASARRPSLADSLAAAAAKRPRRRPRPTSRFASTAGG